MKNEKHVTLNHEHHKSNTAPKRPPQPKTINFEKKEKEGMLIDLTSPQQQDTNNTSVNGAFDTMFMPKLNGMSILDAPIDVPTQAYPDDEFLENDSSKPEPPPYQSPPTYMNTYGICKQMPRYASGISMSHNQYGNLDPFDTSHIGTQQLQSNVSIAGAATVATVMPTYSSHATDGNKSRYDSNFVRNSIQCGNNIKLDLDEIVQNKMASLSPKRSTTPMAAVANTTVESNDTMKQLYSTNEDNCQKSITNTTLSDSLKVNLSSLTLNDTDEFDTQHSMPSTSTEPNPKLDRVFLAELEKEIYKNDNIISNVNMKNAQTNDSTTINSKENTVNAMSNAFNWLKNDFAIGNNEMAAQMHQTKTSTTPLTQSPAKVFNADPTKKQTNFDNTISNSMTFSKKLYNTDANSADPSGYQMGASNASTVNDGNIYSNYGMALTTNNQQSMGNVHETKYNYVTTTANVVSGTTAKKCNASYTAASDIYGNMAAGNVYDTVASNTSDYYELIQPNESQTVIYDEVAGDDLRPHRPAPGPPVLSAQQIQRRIERAQKEQAQQLYDNLGVNIYSNGSNSNYGSTTRNHYVYEEINPKINAISCIDAIESDSKETINAASSGTMKNLKIEQLLR